MRSLLGVAVMAFMAAGPLLWAACTDPPPPAVPAAPSDSGAESGTPAPEPSHTLSTTDPPAPSPPDTTSPTAPGASGAPKGGASPELDRLIGIDNIKQEVRTLANFADGKVPGAESSIEKIYWSEFDKRFRETALDVLGPGGQLLRQSPGARPDVDWAREYLWSRAGTIYSGSSEVQRNIIAKRVLGLPQA